jgi:hypothetical protein
MPSEDVLLQHLSIQLLAFLIETRETLIRMRNKDTTIASAFHGAKNTRSGGCASQANVEIAFERPWGVFFIENLR